MTGACAVCYSPVGLDGDAIGMSGMQLLLGADIAQSHGLVRPPPPPAS